MNRQTLTDILGIAVVGILTLLICQGKKVPQFGTPMAKVSVFPAAVSTGFNLSTFAICY